MEQLEVNYKTNKYKVIREAQQRGLNCRFDVLQYCSVEELDDTEAKWI